MYIDEGLYVDDDFVIFFHGRQTLNIGQLRITFTDGSQVSLLTGAVTDTKAGTPTAIVVHKLLPGENKYSFGSLNMDPSTKDWNSKQISVNYRGPVEILPSTDGKITVEENAHCHASLENGQVKVTMARYMEILIIKSIDNKVNYSNIGGQGMDTLPVLRIWAPSDTSVSGEMESLTFAELSDVDLKSKLVTGLKAQSVKLEAVGPIAINCPIVVGELSIKASDTVVFNNKLSCDLLTVSTCGSVSSTHPISSPTINIETADVVDLRDIGSNTTTINTTGLVTINSGAIINLEVNTSDKVSLINLVSTHVTINSTDRVSIKSCTIAKLDVETNDNVTIDCEQIGDLVIDTLGKVDVKIASGTTNANIDTTDTVTLLFAIANKIMVDSTDNVKISAYQFLNEPEIDTMGNESVKIRI
jgi:hypothetical protein